MISICLWSAAILVTIGQPAVKPDAARLAGESGSKKLDKFRLSLDSATAPITVRRPTSTRWRGRDYDVEAGIEVLLGVVRNQASSTRDREMALSQLGVLRVNLNGRPFLNELSRRFDTAGDLEKLLILNCFISSHDVRAIPFCVHVLDNEKRPTLRVRAAHWLAQWNIRRGVAELVSLLQSKEALVQPGPTPYVRWAALDAFRNSNDRKGWRWVERDWWTPIDSQDSLTDEEKRALYDTEFDKEVEDIKKWFAANKDRFPDWKSGDPLPPNSPLVEEPSP